MRIKAINLEKELKDGDISGVFEQNDRLIRDAKTLVHGVQTWFGTLN